MKKNYVLFAMFLCFALTLNYAKTINNTGFLPVEKPTSQFVVDFGASDTLTCSGIIQFTDLSSNGATAWVWNFGDGGSSIAQNPVHTYTTGGYFTVTLITVGIAGVDSLVKTNFIHVAFLTAPTVSPDTTICAYNPVTLTASGGGQIAWFDAISGGNQLDTGATFTSGPLTATTTFYAASQQAQTPFYGGPADSSLGGGGNYGQNNDLGLVFDCNVSCRLVSVKVYAQGAGNRTIYLDDNNGNQLNSITVNVPDGESRVYLNFDIQPGTGYELVCNGPPNLYRNNTGAVYPYDINGMMSITGNTAGGGALAFYYFFYDWEVSNPPCVSARIPVTITVNPGPQASFIYSQNLSTFTCTDASIGATSWSWDFGDGSAAVLTQNAVHTYAAPGAYVITLTSSNGNCSSSFSDSVVAAIFDFIASDTLTCTGNVQFTDLANNGATAWFWQFGDGGTSIAQNPSHTYTSEGYFTVTFTTVGINGIDSLVKTDYVHVAFLSAPTVSADTTICQFNPVTLTATATGVGGELIAWYDSLVGGNLLDTGTTFTSGPLVTSTTFYAASQQLSPSFYGGPVDSSLGGGGFYGVPGNRVMYFDCNIACRLVSVKVYANGGGPRTIFLNDNNGNQIYAATATVPDGESRVYLNWDIQPGADYELGNPGNSNFYRNNAGAVYPYDINGLLSITGNDGGGANFYYFFYDWQVSTGPLPCVSPRVPINVTVTPGPQASFIYNQNLNVFNCTDLSVGATSWSWDFGDGSAPVTTQNASHSYTTSGTYVITLTAGNGTCSSSTSVTVNATFAGIAEHSSLQVSLQPNPVKDILRIQLPENSNKVRMTLSNCFGQIIYSNNSVQTVKNSVVINLAPFASGVYFLRIEADDKVALRKIIKE